MVAVVSGSVTHGYTERLGVLHKSGYDGVVAVSSRSTQGRRERREEILDATRALLDERGLQDAPIDEIARAAGINKALIYRYFESKDELLALTLDRYLDELDELLAKHSEIEGPVERLDAQLKTLVDYTADSPAFMDCAFALMRRPVFEFADTMSDASLFRLGRSMGRCVDHLVKVLEDGSKSGEFVVTDAATTANLICAQALGMLQMARLGAGVRMTDGGFPETFPLDRELVRRAARAGVLASVATRSAGK